MRVTSAGIVRDVAPVSEMHVSSHQSTGQVATAPAAAAPALEQGESFDNGASFDVDPWLALEENRLGVLMKRLANAPRYPRKKLKYEAEQKDQARQQGQAAQAQQARPGATGPLPMTHGHVQHPQQQQHAQHQHPQHPQHPPLGPPSALPPYGARPHAGGHIHGAWG